MRKSEFISHKELDAISRQAKDSTRLRKNYNFHLSDEEPCNRLLNAMEPGSYIQPHRHNDPNKDETLIVLRGRMGLFIFDDNGAIKNKAILGPQGAIMMANIPMGIYHTLVSLEKDSVFFEAKGGPYRPLSKEEKAPWAPEENAPGCSEYLLELKKILLFE